MDAIALRHYLKGSDAHESVGLGQTLLADSEITKVFVGEGTLLQLGYEFGQGKGLSNFVTVSSSGELQDDSVDHRIRPVDPQQMAGLCQQACQQLSLENCSAITRKQTVPKKPFEDTKSSLVKDLD